MSNKTEKAKQVREVAKHLIDSNNSYQYHKENMAHACIVLEFAIFVWIMSQAETCQIGSQFGKLWLFIVWLLMHMFMRWQLRNRRFASIQISALEQNLRKWCIDNGPNEEELAKYKNMPTKRSWWQVVLDLLIPLFKYGIPLHRDGEEDRPKALVVDTANLKTERDWLKKHWRLYVGEWFPTIASCLIIVAIILFCKTPAPSRIESENKAIRTSEISTSELPFKSIDQNNTMGDYEVIK